MIIKPLPVKEIRAVMTGPPPRQPECIDCRHRDASQGNYPICTSKAGPFADMPAPATLGCQAWEPIKI